MKKIDFLIICGQIIFLSLISVVCFYIDVPTLGYDVDAVVIVTPTTTSTPTLSPVVFTLPPTVIKTTSVRVIPAYDEHDLYWMAKIINAEAGCDTDEGQIAVGNVVMNRVNSPNFPNDIYSVIWQKTGKIWQFSPCGDGGIKREPTERAFENARAVLDGERILPEDILFFYMPTEGNKNDWIRSREIYKKIGVHRFCY